jgi:hypothetical protein
LRELQRVVGADSLHLRFPGYVDSLHIFVSVTAPTAVIEEVAELHRVELPLREDEHGYLPFTRAGKQNRIYLHPNGRSCPTEVTVEKVNVFGEKERTVDKQRSGTCYCESDTAGVKVVQLGDRDGWRELHSRHRFIRETFPLHRDPNPAFYRSRRAILDMLEKERYFTTPMHVFSSGNEFISWMR